MTAAGPGPKMILDQVEAAERVVADSVQQMQAVAQQLQAQSALSLTAMKAPAGQITSTNYDAHSGAGRALAETLAQLQADLDAHPPGPARGLRPGDPGRRPGRGRDRWRRRGRHRRRHRLAQQPALTSQTSPTKKGNQSWAA